MGNYEAIEPHPVVIYAKQRGWNYTKTAEFLECSYGSLRQIVRGFRGVSVERADDWERRTSGEVRAIDVLRWHSRNRRSDACAA